jgi:hypothetical protein
LGLHKLEHWMGEICHLLRLNNCLAPVHHLFWKRSCPYWRGKGQGRWPLIQGRNPEGNRRLGKSGRRSFENCLVYGTSPIDNGDFHTSLQEELQSTY